MKDRRSNMDDGRIRPEINLHVEPKKDGCLERDVDWIRKAALVWWIQAQDGSCGLRMRRQPSESSRKPPDCRSLSKKTDLLSSYWRWGIGHCGGVNPLKKKKKNCTYRRWLCRSTGPHHYWDNCQNFIGCHSGRTHVRKERWQWLESDHHNPEKKPTRGNKRCCKHSPRKKRNGDTPLGYSGWTALRREQCNKMPESQNRGATSWATDRSVSIVTTRQTVILIGTRSHCMTTDKLNPSIRCSLFSSRRTVLRGWLWGLRQIPTEKWQSNSDTGRRIK
jgi:hypothetical protein